VFIDAHTSVQIQVAQLVYWNSFTGSQVVQLEAEADAQQLLSKLHEQEGDLLLCSSSPNHWSITLATFRAH